jgi:hypothetical protein
MKKKFIITFYERNDRGHRRFRFQPRRIAASALFPLWETPAEVYFRMMEWLDEQNITKIMRINDIDYAITDTVKSSIIVPAMTDEQAMMIRMLCGRDIVIRPEDEIRPNRRKEAKLNQPDRYAR